MNNQVPNTDPSLSAKQRVRKIYPNSFYSNCANKIISENGVGGITLGISWDDAASKLPAAVSEVMLPPNGLCWFGDGSCKKPQTNTSFYCADHEHKKPVAPQGTVEGETPREQALWEAIAISETLWRESDNRWNRCVRQYRDEIQKLVRVESVAPPSVAMQERETGYCPKGGPEMYVFYELIEGLAPIPWEVYKVEDVKRFRPVSGEGSGVPALDELIEAAGALAYWSVFRDTSQETIDYWKDRLATIRAALSSPLQEGARNGVLMEALKAVENERLEKHDARLQEALAIRDAENAIKALMVAPPDTKGGS